MSTRIIIDGADFTVNGIDVMTNPEKTAPRMKKTIPATV